MDIIQSPVGRISWPFVFGEGDDSPKAGPSKYKITLMLPKNKKAFRTLGINPKQQKTLLKQIEDFLEDFRTQAKDLAKATFKDKWKKTRFDPVLDGDEKADAWEGNADFWLIRCKTKFKPKVGGPKAGTKILDGDEDESTGFYAGCWARVALSIYTYNVDGNLGVGVGLSYVQKAWNDEAFQQGGFEFDDDVTDLEIDESDQEQFDDDDNKDDDDNDQFE